tara:strand:- start:593 stop:1396 length:804 start_codon:yes stop_codon:yes gene_type:complete
MINILFATFLKDYRNYLSYKFNLVGELIVVTTLITIIFFISKVFDGTASQYLLNYGNNYFEFLFTGIVVIFFSSRTISSLPFFISNMQMLGILEKLIIKDKFFIIVISHFAFPVAQSFFRLFLFFLISFLLFSSPISLIGFVEVCLILSVMSLSILGISLIIASFVLVEKRATFLTSLIILSIILFSGALYPIEVMPEIIQKFSYFMPTRIGVDLIRAMIVNELEFFDLASLFIFLTSMGIVLIMLGRYMLYIGLGKAKKNGTISHY